MSRCRTAVSVLAVVALAGVLVGCGGVRHNLTPELRTMSDRPVDSANMFWSTWNEETRMAWDDFHRGALYNRPPRLAPYPTGR